MHLRLCLPSRARGFGKLLPVPGARGYLLPVDRGMARGPVGGAAAPRRVGGGRSDRYDERRAQRGVGARRAREWSDAAAAAVLESVLHNSSRLGEGILQHRLLSIC